MYFKITCTFDFELKRLYVYTYKCVKIINFTIVEIQAAFENSK